MTVPPVTAVSQEAQVSLEQREVPVKEDYLE